MAPLKPEQKESIIKRLNFARLELQDLSVLGQVEFKDYQNNRQLRRNLERLVENLANAAIDIAKIYLASESEEIPETYTETVFKLADLGLFDKQTATELASLVRARNVLAHQYLDLSWALIKQFLNQGIAALKQFLNVMAEKVEQAS